MFARVGRRPFGLGRRPFGLGRRPFRIGRRPFRIGRRPFRLGRRPFGIVGGSAVQWRDHRKRSQPFTPEQCAADRVGCRAGLRRGSSDRVPHAEAARAEHYI